MSLQQLKSFFKMEEKTSFFFFKEKICDLVHFFIFCFIPEKGTEQWREKKESEEETWNGEGYWKS